ncbi:MAG: hypothetical protein NTV94_03970 [Planctomycetota bacterium]|nr:hypothetical protein [Planctomycetota bacterium]
MDKSLLFDGCPVEDIKADELAGSELLGLLAGIGGGAVDGDASIDETTARTVPCRRRGRPMTGSMNWPPVVVISMRRAWAFTTPISRLPG